MKVIILPPCAAFSSDAGVLVSPINNQTSYCYPSCYPAILSIVFVVFHYFVQRAMWALHLHEFIDQLSPKTWFIE